MALERPTPQPPTSTGWYVVWHPRPAGGHQRRLYFCVETNTDGDMACMSARPSETEDFLPTCHTQFANALWHGPFKTRKEANDVLRTA